MIDSCMIFIVVKIPLEFDNEIYALNSSSLKPEKKEKKDRSSVEGKLSSNFLTRLSPLANKEFLFSTIRGWLPLNKKEMAPMNAEVHRERSECNGKS